MKLAIPFDSLRSLRAGFVTSLLLVAVSSSADPLYLDQLVETPLETLQQQFPSLKKDGCYALGGDRFLHISIHKKERKPWRVVLSSEAPCKKPEAGPALDVRARSGIDLGFSTIAVVERLGRPDADAPPNPDQRRLGDIEYFYVCRVSDSCARHISVFMRQGAVTAISEWYSE